MTRLVGLCSAVALSGAVALLSLACGIDSAVRVEVVDEAGRPIADAAVQLVPLDGPPLGPAALGSTDATGRHERELVPGRYGVQASADGFDPARQEFSVVGGIPVLVRVVLRRVP